MPLKAGTYLVKAEDSSGLTSVTAAAIAAKNASVLTFSSLDVIQEDPDFLGTHDGTTTTGGVLKLGGAMLIDDAPDFDAITDFDLSGGIAPQGIYYFASGTDNGAVAKVRVESSLALQTVNVLDQFDSRTGNIDDWLDFDGSSAGGSVDAWVEARETDDDPSGSPVWSGWRRVDAADFEAWGLEYRAVLTTADPAFNVHVTKLAVNIKELA